MIKPKGIAMIKTLIADMKALLARIEADIAGHPTQGLAAANVKAAVTALERHPDATAAPSTFVSPGKEVPEAGADAPAAPVSPANDPSVGDGAATVEIAPSAAT